MKEKVLDKKKKYNDKDERKRRCQIKKYIYSEKDERKKKNKRENKNE